jgi:NPCBM-associated, NEW3 domain of alpha-galactosidase
VKARVIASGTVILAAVGTGILATSASASTPMAGLGVGGTYIGDTVTNPQFQDTQANAIPGNTPVAPGTSASFAEEFANTGNVTEAVTIAQATTAQESWLTGIYPKYSLVPSSWISSTFPASVSLAPGQSVSGTVKVTVPAGASAGEYDGLFQGIASASGSGNVQVDSGAAQREYITVP